MAGGRGVPSSELLLDVEREERAAIGYKQIPHFIYFHPIGFAFWLRPLSAFLSLGSQVVSVAPRSPEPTYLRVGTSLERVCYSQ